MASRRRTYPANAEMASDDAVVTTTPYSALPEAVIANSMLLLNVDADNQHNYLKATLERMIVLQNHTLHSMAENISQSTQVAREIGEAIVGELRAMRGYAAPYIPPQNNHYLARSAQTNGTFGDPSPLKIVSCAHPAPLTIAQGVQSPTKPPHANQAARIHHAQISDVKIPTYSGVNDAKSIELTLQCVYEAECTIRLDKATLRGHCFMNITFMIEPKTKACKLARNVKLKRTRLRKLEQTRKDIPKSPQLSKPKALFPPASGRMKTILDMLPPMGLKSPAANLEAFNKEPTTYDQGIDDAFGAQRTFPASTYSNAPDWFQDLDFASK